jgi:signal transduction histidine kinase
MAETTAATRARVASHSDAKAESRIEKNPAIDFFTDDLDCDTSDLTPEELRALCERLRDESRRRTVALASAVHELRTPLAVMDGYIEVLSHEKAGELSPKQKQILEDMRLNGKRLKRFIADFLSFSAIETKHPVLNLEPGDLNNVLADVCATWMPRFQKKGVALYFLPQQDLAPFDFDHLKIQHIVSNLIHNAWKFTPPSGTVWVTAERVPWERRLRQEIMQSERRSEAKKLPKGARIIVSDTGPGIEPEFHQEIFNDFRKLTGPGNAPDSMGLGLSIARRMVNAHSGKIWVESKPGAGSKFYFVIPIPRKPEETKGKAK